MLYYETKLSFQTRYFLEVVLLTIPSTKKRGFFSDGWCPTESGDKYLKIDLQNEYRITRVVVMGDKNQTKWSGSYSVKYSHDESLVDGSSAVQVSIRVYL